MKFPVNTAALVAILASTGTTASTLNRHRSRSTDHFTTTESTVSNSSNSLPGLPSGCMLSAKGIAWGWLPDDMDSAVSMSSLNSATGKKACFFGDYSKINDASYDGSDITYKASKAEGAIMVPSVMPVGVKWSEVTSSLASKIGTAMEAFTKQGLTVYLRFAHEMNCYAKSGCASPEYPGGEDFAAFKQAWINVADVCKGIDGCYMMWSPNLQDLDTLKNWWPGTEHVDIVAVDHYPSSDSDVEGGFKGNYDKFYTEYVKPYGKPFILGETAYGGDSKYDWVKDITNSDFSSYPLYKGAMWFEYVSFLSP